MANRFQRGNFVVSDLDRSVEFYTNVLGMDLDFVKESEPDSYSYIVFNISRERRLRFAMLSYPDQARVMALTEIDGELDPLQQPIRSAIVIEVPDFDGTVTRAEDYSCHVFPEEQLLTPDGREGRQVGIQDPDGNLIVIYFITYHPDEKSDK